LILYNTLYALLYSAMAISGAVLIFQRRNLNEPDRPCQSDRNGCARLCMREHCDVHAIDQVPRKTVAQEVALSAFFNRLRRMSLGYTGLLADIYWTRAVQYFGEQHHNGSGDFRLLAPLLEVTTELDPRLLPAYQFGANFLAPKPPSGAGLPGAALSLIRYGVAHNPNQWRFTTTWDFCTSPSLRTIAWPQKLLPKGRSCR